MINKNIVYPDISDNVSFDERSIELLNSSSEGCVHLISPSASEEELWDSEDEENYDVSDGYSVCSDESSYWFNEERSDSSCYDRRLRSFCSDERERVHLSESDKAVLFGKQSVPRIPSTYPHVRKMASGKIRYSTSPLHPIEQYNRSRHGNKQYFFGGENGTHCRVSQSSNIKCILTPVPEALNRKGCYVQRCSNRSRISVKAKDNSIHVEKKGKLMKRRGLSERVCLDKKQCGLEVGGERRDDKCEVNTRSKIITERPSVYQRMLLKRKNKQGVSQDYGKLFRLLRYVR